MPHVIKGNCESEWTFDMENEYEDTLNAYNNMAIQMQVLMTEAALSTWCVPITGIELPTSEFNIMIAQCSLKIPLEWCNGRGQVVKREHPGNLESPYIPKTRSIPKGTSRFDFTIIRTLNKRKNNVENGSYLISF